MPRVRNPVMTLRLAKRYLKKVKNTVSPEEYQIFMSLIQKTKDKRSDVGLTVRKVIELLKHNRGLLSGFNRFLPKGYRIVPILSISSLHITNSRSRKSAMPQVRNPVLTLRLAKRYLKKVKNTVSPEEYQIFMSLIQETKDKRSDVGPTLWKVIELFKHHGGWLTRFNRFLPKGYRIVPLMMPGQFRIIMERSEAFRRSISYAKSRRL